MVGSESSRKIQQLVWDSDMAAAARQLLLFSDQEDSNSHNNCNSNSSSINVKKVSFDDHQEEIDQRSHDKVSKQKKIEEIFRTENEKVYHPKKRKYQSLVCIYRTTKPICR